MKWTSHAASFTEDVPKEEYFISKGKVKKEKQGQVVVDVKWINIILGDMLDWDQDTMLSIGVVIVRKTVENLACPKTIEEIPWASSGMTLDIFLLFYV